MGNTIGVIRVNEGIVLGADLFSSNEESHIARISNTTAILIMGDVSAGRNFCKQYLAKYSDKPGSIDTVIQEGEATLSKPQAPFLGKSFLLSLLGYGDGFSYRPMTVLDFNGQTVTKRTDVVFTLIQFAHEALLGPYLAAKILTRDTSLKSATRLMVYIMKQYNLIFPNIGQFFEIATISQNGFHQLTAQELPDLVASAETADINTKKKTWDLFTKNLEMRHP